MSWPDPPETKPPSLDASDGELVFLVPNGFRALTLPVSDLPPSQMISSPAFPKSLF